MVSRLGFLVRSRLLGQLRWLLRSASVLLQELSTVRNHGRKEHHLILGGSFEKGKNTLLVSFDFHRTAGTPEPSRHEPSPAIWEAVLKQLGDGSKLKAQEKRGTRGVHRLIRGLEHCFFPNSWDDDPIWRTHIFRRCRYTTNYQIFWDSSYLISSGFWVIPFWPRPTRSFSPSGDRDGLSIKPHNGLLRQRFDSALCLTKWLRTILHTSTVGSGRDQLSILVCGLEHEFYFSIYWECHHPNWRSPSFFRGVGSTTNQNNIQPSILVKWTIFRTVYIMWNVP